MLPVDTTKFTKTERAILEILSDGKPHHRDELRDRCDLSGSSSVTKHIQKMRPKVARVGQLIPCVLVNRRIHYQHVQMLDISQD